jgi:hypothetical protein
VDEKSLICTHDQQETVDQNAQQVVIDLADRLETLTQKSERLVYVTGGGLQPPKCLWYSIAWGWRDDGKSFMLSIDQTPASIELTVGDSNTPLPIQRKRTDKTSRTPGCYLAPDSNTKDEENILRNKGLHYGAAQRKRGTSKVEVYYKYMNYINPGMSYPMPLSNISHTTLTNIQRPYLRPTKQQMGFRGTIDDAFMHAP